MSKKTVFLALPDVQFSSAFLMSMLSTVNKLISDNKYNLVIVPGSSKHLSMSHFNTLGLDPKRGVDQKPFDGEKFDYWVNVSSSTIFNADQFIKLIESLEEHPVVAGLCRMDNLESCSFIENGGFTKISELEEWKKANPDTKYKKVLFSEMKFFGVRSEVLYAMKYPHFECEPVLTTTANGDIVRELMNDEMAFCKNVKSAGYDIMVNTQIVLGNEVRIIV
jgi:hypothetical protein